MDFSAVADLSEYPEIKTFSKSTRIPVIFNSPKQLGQYDLTPPLTAQRKKQQQQRKISMNITNFSVQKPNSQLGSYVGTQKMHETLYKKENSFDQTLRCHKEFRSLNSPKVNLHNFTEQGKFFKIQRADFQKLRGYKVQNRCQTAEVIDKKGDFEGKVQKGRLRSPLLIRKELIPQTRAFTIIKPIIPEMALRIQGVLKDISIRKCNHFNTQS